jgi:hypothetical protein
MGLTLTEIFAIIIIHWIADFVLQTDKQAKGKSKNWNDLLSHTLTYSFVWLFIGGCIYLNQFKPYNIEWNKAMNSYWSYWIPRGLLFVLITFIAHTITDYFTSRLNSRLWAEGKVHNFFVSVGADQVYHYIQLFLTYYYLKTL